MLYSSLFFKNDVAPNIISNTKEVHTTKDDSLKNTNESIIKPAENIDEAVVISSKADNVAKTTTNSYQEKKEDRNSNALSAEAAKKDTKNKSR
ncbi:hypothetical protein ACU8V7_11265 [Zobellia nedashkovskayae]